MFENVISSFVARFNLSRCAV